MASMVKAWKGYEQARKKVSEGLKAEAVEDHEKGQTEGETGVH